MRRDGWVGWALVAGVVIGWDVAACLTGGETLSNAYGDAIRHPSRRRKVRLASFALALHLLGPKGLGPIDPLHLAAERLRQRRRNL